MKNVRLLTTGLIVTGLLLAVGALIIVFTQEASDEDGLRPGRELLSNASQSDNECIVCHANHTPGIIAQYGESQHFRNDVSCANCHEVEENYPGGLQHPDQSFWVLPKSSAGKCETCHKNEVSQYNFSRHALPAYVAYAGSSNLPENLLSQYESIPEGGFLEGGNARNAIHAMEGHDITQFACETCHDVGKPNPDGSVGDCTACHLRHEFSLEQVRKPETCNACHIGPDHPQWEIYQESPHGIAYATGGDDWHWDAEPGTLTTADFPAPTCATCHFSGFGSAGTTHDVGDRLKWYLFAPISVERPNSVENRNEMQGVCQACHSTNYIETFFSNADDLVDAVNTWVKLSDEMMRPLKENSLLTAQPFDESEEYVYFEIWHHWGRTAKFGAFMQGPDYTQWHGAYEMMKDLTHLRELINERLEANGLEPLELPPSFPSMDAAREHLQMLADEQNAPAVEETEVPPDDATPASDDSATDDAVTTATPEE